MNTSGDAAEQVVRLSLEGTEVALKLTGSAAKNVAAAIYAILKDRDKNKTKGHQRLSAMLKSGKPLQVFTVSEKHLKQFATEAKRYGVVYCALRDKGASHDGLVDVMVRAEDAAKINRIVERFKLSTVDAAAIKHDIEQSRTEKQADPAAPEQAKPERSTDDELLDDMLGVPIRKEERTSPNPTAAKTEKSTPSGPISETPSKTDEGTAKDRPSVREELTEIKKRREKEGHAPKHAAPDKGTSLTTPTSPGRHLMNLKKKAEKAR